MGLDDYRREFELILQKIDDENQIADENQLFADLERLGLGPKYIRDILILTADDGVTPAENRKNALECLRERLETLKRAPSKT